MMIEPLLQPRMVRAPEFPAAAWLNAEQPLTLAGLRGRAVLVDFWEYSCVNCLRTLPYLREWERRYGRWLTIIGVHAPEFAFGRERQNIEWALREHDLRYPVVLDNDYAIWDAFANRAWPSRYLIDQSGYIRCFSQGEGSYERFERAIQQVLREADADLDLPPLMLPLRAEDAPGAVCHRPTPELRGGLDRGALGNPEGYAGSVPVVYALPQERQRGAFYVSGAWQASEQCLVYRGQTEAVIQLPYEAVEVNAVLSPHVELVERMLHPEPVAVEVWQDGAPLAETARGGDVTADGRILVDRPRLYNLVRNPGFERHELTLRLKSRGFALYAFSFTACAKSAG